MASIVCNVMMALLVVFGNNGIPVKAYIPGTFHPYTNSIHHWSIPSNPSHRVSAAAAVRFQDETETVLDETTNQVNNNTTKTKSWLDDGFVFGLEGSGLERPRGKVALTVVEGDSLETKAYQVVFVVATFVAHSLFLVHSFSQLLVLDGSLMNTILHTLGMTIASWVLADFGSGVLHHAVDNYGSGRTPVMGSIIAAFQGHHTAPWTITQRGFCNNVYKLCMPFGVVPVALVHGMASPAVSWFVTTFCIWEILSQEFHKWAHMTKSETGPIINTMQNIGFTVSRKPHALHHQTPFDGNYCIISGVCNPWLDQTGFFRRLEHNIYRWNGVEANAWKLDAALREHTLAGNYDTPPTFRKQKNKATSDNV